MVHALDAQQGSESSRKAPTFHCDVSPVQDVGAVLVFGGGFMKARHGDYWKRPEFWHGFDWDDSEWLSFEKAGRIPESPSDASIRANRSVLEGVSEGRLQISQSTQV